FRNIEYLKEERRRFVERCSEFLEIAERILENVSNEPTTSTRSIANQLRVSK
ncbi:hypothetical protein ABEB36_015169, partial [Hypothenemus hampei]